MAWEGSTRAERLPPDWPKRRLRVLRRDGYRCRAIDPHTGERCGEPARDVDHVERGDDHSLDNLQALCRWHHARKSAKEGASARGPRPTQNRLPEAHPGLNR